MCTKYAFSRISAILLLVLTISACKKAGILEPLSPVLHAIQLEVPVGFPVLVENPDNPLTVEGIELGRKLFYDVRLSRSNKISCASCHHQNLAFTDGTALNHVGETGTTLSRHAPALFNLAWATNGLFWDGGSTNLESQAFGPLTSADEMRQNLSELETELKQESDYASQFKLVFNEEVRSANVVKALAQFQRTLISAGSRYDRYKRNESDGSLTELELSGMALVNSKCRSCHSTELFTDNSYHNNGIDDSFSDEKEGIYQGRFRVSFDPADMGKFKTPSLRNLLLTAPYMHDGRFKTIDEVLDHYTSGIKNSPNTDPLLYQNLGSVGIPMTTLERKAIVAFLNTLTDNDFTSNKKISNPFN
jgi:cytochrome c peroxidase